MLAAVVYGNASDYQNLTHLKIPVLRHLAGVEGVNEVPNRDDERTYYYGDTVSHKFAQPFTAEFSYSTEAVSHTRNLTFLKPVMGGPFFDLEDIWEEHMYYEFTDRSVEHTMSTMVQEPYVNHIPTVRIPKICFQTLILTFDLQMTGGIGREALTAFYRENFIFLNSQDTEQELLSRTIGVDRIVDEFLFKFTHDKQLDWL